MSPRILICDDEIGPRESLRMILKDKYELLFAEDGQQAVDLLAEEKVDLILIDINMPRLSGIEALQRIKAIDNEVEVLVITGFGSLDTAIQAMKHGAYDYITKPFDMNAILSLVEKGMARRRASSGDGGKEPESPAP